MTVTTVDTMWCVTLVSVPYTACRAFSFATPPIRGRVVSPTILNRPKQGYFKTSLAIHVDNTFPQNRNSKFSQ